MDALSRPPKQIYPLSTLFDYGKPASFVKPSPKTKPRSKTTEIC